MTLSHVNIDRAQLGIYLQDLPNGPTKVTTYTRVFVGNETDVKREARKLKAQGLDGMFHVRREAMR